MAVLENSVQNLDLESSMYFKLFMGRHEVVGLFVFGDHWLSFEAQHILLT